jgi:AcrR family transcriptional regulator
MSLRGGAVLLYGRQPQRRRDAQRNRSAILQAATEVMTSPGPEFGMPEIARRAGIGQATLYRHFPDRLALAGAVIADHLGRLEDCVAAGGDQPGTFTRALDAILRTQVAMRPLVLLARRLDAGSQSRYLQRVGVLLAEPMRRAQAHGQVRADLVPADLVLLLSMVEGAVAAAGDADRAIDLALNGVFRRGHPNW